MTTLIAAKSIPIHLHNFMSFIRAIEEEPAFRQQMRGVFDQCFEQFGRGMVVSNEDRGSLHYLTLENFLKGAGNCGVKDHTQRLVETCNLETQIAAMAMFNNGAYQSFLLNIPREVKS